MSDDNEIFELGDKNPCNRQFMRDAAGVVRYESPKAWAAFKKFCELEDSRSVRAVAKACDKSRSLIGRWASRWRWTERAAAYDSRMQEAVRAGAIQARRQMAERQSRTAVLGQNLAVTAFLEIQERLQAKGKHTGLTPYEACRLFEACSKVERLARGGTDTDNDEVAAIHVHVDLQTRPRYLDDTAARGKRRPLTIDPEDLKNLDS
jgi:hypothetical protein